LTNHEAANDGPSIFDGIDYMPGSATLTAPSGTQLDQLAAVLNPFQGARISVEGHTDNLGDAGASTKLSAQRAATVKAELVAMGVSAERLSTVGYGPSRPIVGNGSEEGRARNRRMQVTIIQR
jgi:outer membrane protein OmpA-like peptidoglycan-associated protein